MKKSIFILSLSLTSCVMMKKKTEDKQLIPVESVEENQIQPNQKAIIIEYFPPFFDKQFSEANVVGNSFSLNYFSVKKLDISLDVTVNNQFQSGFNDYVPIVKDDFMDYMDYNFQAFYSIKNSIKQRKGTVLVGRKLRSEYFMNTTLDYCEKISFSGGIAKKYFREDDFNTDNTTDFKEPILDQTSQFLEFGASYVFWYDYSHKIKMDKYDFNGRIHQRHELYSKVLLGINNQIQNFNLVDSTLINRKVGVSIGYRFHLPTNNIRSTIENSTIQKMNKLINIFDDFGYSVNLAYTFYPQQYSNLQKSTKGIDRYIINPFSFNVRLTYNILFPKEARNLPSL